MDRNYTGSSDLLKTGGFLAALCHFQRRRWLPEFIVLYMSSYVDMVVLAIPRCDNHDSHVPV